MIGASEASAAAPSLVLASASPRRRDLLRILIRTFRVQASDIEERIGPGPLEAALAELARDKARAVAAAAPETLFLAADTVVVLGDRVLGKPADEADARAMLQALRGRTHRVLTAVVVLDARTGVDRSVVVESQVLMSRFHDDALDRYVASGEPFGKAGGYAIQGRGGALVTAVVGSYSNVVGLPLGETRGLLSAAGLALDA